MTTHPNPCPQSNENRAESSPPPTEAGQSAEQLVTIRRAPSILAFSITGIVLGVLLAAVLSFITWPEGLLTGGQVVDRYTQEYSTFSVFGVLAVTLGALGAAVGSVIALILDRRSAKRSETVRAIPAEED